MIERQELVEAIDHALAGNWEAAHAIVQRDESELVACWIHAVLHKMEPDESNSRYWYRRAGKAYEAYPDGCQELIAIKAALTY